MQELAPKKSFGICMFSTSTFKGVTNGSPYTTKGPPFIGHPLKVQVCSLFLLGHGHFIQCTNNLCFDGAKSLSASTEPFAR